MRSWIVPALQLIRLSSFVVDAAILHPVGHLEPRDNRETQQSFDQTTESFKQQGLCRVYVNQRWGIKGLETCEPKCGDLVKKAKQEDKTTSLSCVTGGISIPTITDPSGDEYSPGTCVCDIPVFDELINDIVMALPAVAEIGCGILFGAFDAILEIGAMAIPGVGEMTAGMKAGIQAAKTVAENGQDASSFAQWFANPCGKSKYVDMIDKIFNPLSNVPDSVVPGLGCKGKKCPGKNGSGGKNGPDDDSKGGQPKSKKDDPPSTRIQPTPANTQPPQVTGQNHPTKAGEQSSKKDPTRGSKTRSSSTRSPSPTRGCKKRSTKKGGGLIARDPSQLRMDRWVGSTYYGFVEVKVKTMENCQVEEYAKRGYDLIKDKHDWNGVVMVSALFVPDIGVFVGSKPRGVTTQDKRNVVEALKKKIKDKFPRWDVAAEGREHSDPQAGEIDKFHSEDKALIDGGAKFYEIMKVKSNKVNFPKGTHIATWGTYTADDSRPNSLKPPCGGSTQTQISKPCMEVLDRLKVTYSVP